VANSKAGKLRRREVPFQIRFNSDYVAGGKNGWIKNLLTGLIRLHRDKRNTLWLLPTVEAGPSEIEPRG
jgi:hypothetical protein